MNRKFLSLLFVLFTLTLLIVACGGEEPTATPAPASASATPAATATSIPPTATAPSIPPTATPSATATAISPPTLELEAEAYHDEKNGYTIRYPAGWDFLAQDDGVFFFESMQAIQGMQEGTAPSVPLVIVETGPQDVVSGGGAAGAQNAVEMINLFIEDDQGGAGFEVMGEAQEISVAETDAAYVDLRWTVDQTTLTGRIVVIYMDDWGIMVIGAGSDESWEPFVPTFEAILGSMELYEPEITVVEPIRQWAVEAEAGSQYGDPSWAALQATGAPDTPECGDVSTAWASLSGSAVEWINLYYETPVVISEINIVQTYNPDQVSQVDLIDMNGEYITIYTQEPAPVDEACPYTLSIIQGENELLAQGVRIVVDQSSLNMGWNEIDAVEIVGLPGEGIPTRPRTDEETGAAVLEAIWHVGGESGFAEGEFNSIEGMDIGPDGNLYTADSLDRIIVTSPDGEFLTFLGEEVLWVASDVKVTDDGTLYVADWSNNAVLVLSAEGELLAQWGQEGTGDGEFGTFYPQNLAVCPDGLVYVADSNENAAGDEYERIQVFDGTGDYVTQWNLSEIASGYSLTAMECRADGKLVLLGFIGGSILVIDPADGSLLETLGEGALAWTAPQSLALDPAGNYYVSTWNEGVLKLNPEGTLIRLWGAAGAREDLPRGPGQFYYPDAITVDLDGNIYLGDWGGQHSYVTKFVFP